MDIGRIKKISEAKIKAGYVVNKVRNTLKEFEHGRQDVQEELSEVYKPIVKAQEDVKQKIDEKQAKMLEQLQKNQRAITSGLEDRTMLQQLPDVQPQTTKLPIDYKCHSMPSVTDHIWACALLAFVTARLIERMASEQTD